MDIRTYAVVPVIIVLTWFVYLALNTNRSYLNGEKHFLKKELEQVRELLEAHFESLNVSSNKEIVASKEYTDLEVIYKERAERVRKACYGRETEMKGKLHPTQVNHNIIIDKVWKVAYCPIEKTASTFWRRIMRIVVGDIHASSPFDDSVMAFASFDSLASVPKDAIEAFMNESLTFMFVREPYGRLLSAYVDKLFSPNLFFWKIYGGFAVDVTRNQSSTRCGHDLTFREFVKTVLYAEEHNIKRNGHFTPSYEHCDPCKYNWKVIGALETLPQDVFYILNRMGRTDLKRSLEKEFREQYLNDTITDQFNWLFEFKKNYASECNVTLYEAQLRLWKQFQIRGVLTKEIKFPISAEESENLTKEQLKRIVYNAMGNAETRARAKLNKKEAFLEAYATIDAEDLEKLSELFRPDCELYGYDCRPSKLFKMNRAEVSPWFFKMDHM
ncbi:carbohydrate sulfotransferase 11-like [Argopecten irradians]|uniref:carbohydrate sulfotransferase 11-like n=1 Tax=Argopecten irradians TaxID=31199 RepID=UPI0037170BD6